MHSIAIQTSVVISACMGFTLYYTLEISACLYILLCTVHECKIIMLLISA